MTGSNNYHQYKSAMTDQRILNIPTRYVMFTVIKKISLCCKNIIQNMRISQTSEILPVHFLGKTNPPILTS
jgi:hypothetical protein